MPQHVFGSRAGNERIAVTSVPRADRRAEIRCDSDHLVGVVTDEEMLFGGPPQSLRSSHRPVVRCVKCARATPDYEVETARLRARLSGSTRALLKLRLDEVAVPLLEKRHLEG
jgi:hypothetical protein